MTMRQDRDNLIDAIIALTLSYEDDTVCMSDHMLGKRGTLIYYIREFLENNNGSDILKTYTAGNRVYVKLTADAPRLAAPDISDLPVSVRDKYQNHNSLGYNTDHDRAVAELYATIATAPPPVYVPMPFTTVQCDEPYYDAKYDGHMSLPELCKLYPNMTSTVPHGPSPVTIRHIYETVRQTRSGADQ